MSAEHHHEEQSNPIASLIGLLFLIGCTVALVAMLAFVGMSFVGGIKASAIGNGPDPVTPIAPGDTPTTPGTNPTTPVTPIAVGEEDQMVLGKKAYMTCAACHGQDGKGLPVGPALMAPSLIGSEMMLGDPDLSLLIVLKGIQKENMDHMGVMASLGAALDDKKLAAVLTYCRNTWGNKADPVTVKQAADARAKFSKVVAPAGVKRADISKIVSDHK